MVQFEARMDRERHDPWGSKYLDYALLKRRIKDASSYTDDGRKELVAALTNVFQGLFDNEVEKVRSLVALWTSEELSLLERILVDMPG